MEVPDYCRLLTIVKGVQDEDEYGNAGSVEQMLQKTLIFAEKKFNKRNDGEDLASGFIISDKYDLKQLKGFVKHLETNGGIYMSKDETKIFHYKHYINVVSS